MIEWLRRLIGKEELTPEETTAGESLARAQTGALKAMKTLSAVTPQEPETALQEVSFVVNELLVVEAGSEGGYYAPHCDARVLHSPMECEHCDKFPVRQRVRVERMVEFTGHPVREGWAPCPADAARGLAGAHVWYGNTPKPKGAV